MVAVNPFMTLWSAALLLIYSLYLYKTVVNNDLFNPVSVFVGSMLLPYSFINIHSNYGLSNQFHVIWILCVSLFVLGYYLTSKKAVRLKTPESSIFRSKYQHFLIRIFLFVGVIGLFLGFLNTLELAQTGPRGPFYNIRAGRTKEHIDLGVGGYFLIFLDVGTVMMIVRGYSARQYLPFIGLWILSVGFTFARTELLTALLAVTVALYYRKAVLEDIEVGYKPLMVLVSLFLSGFFAIGYSLNKLGDGAISGFIYYLTVPFQTFDQSILPLGRCTDSIFDATSLYPFNRVLQILGINDAIQYQCHIPPRAAKSVLHIPYLDFGLTGVILFFLVIGILYGLIHSQVRTGNQYMIMFYSLFSFPLSISFYGYTFDQMAWIYYFLAISSVQLMGFLFGIWDTNKYGTMVSSHE